MVDHKEPEQDPAHQPFAMSPAMNFSNNPALHAGFAGGGMPGLFGGMPMHVPTMADVLMARGSVGVANNPKVGNEPEAPPDHAAHPAASGTGSGGGYHSPYAGAMMSGIQNTTVDAKKYDREINGRTDGGHGYGVYAPSPQDARADISTKIGPSAFGGRFQKEIHAQTNIPMSKVDALSDIAAVTQYAAAADQAIKFEKGDDGKPKVDVDWKQLGEIPIQSNLQFDANGRPLPGSQQITYDSPKAMAEKGAAAVLETVKKPDDKNQFLSITGHSGGGQSSFYTALKLATDGYKNISVVGVDMAMTPQQRQILESMGVKITNITSNTKDDKGAHTSEVGEFIKMGMGGGDNYYDLNVQRQSAGELAQGGAKPADMLGRHSITNDANVTTMVRFAQYLDANNKHGQFTDDMYKKFLADTNQTGDELQMEGGGHLTASQNLLGQVEDNRGKGMGGPRSEADFANYFAELVKSDALQALPLPEKLGIGPLSGNPKEAAAKKLAEMAKNNVPGLVHLLQEMGVDTTHIRGLTKYNDTSVSKHWGKFNHIDVPLPDWLSGVKFNEVR